MSSTTIESVTDVARRAAAYARLSRDSAKTGQGVERQLEDIRRLAHLRGFNLTVEHVDNDVSAAGGKSRRAFEQMLAQVARGEVDVVIAWAWDRLSRNRRDTVRLIEIGQEARVTVALVRGSDIDMASASGRLVADLLAGVSRAEIDAKSERQQRASLQRAEQGKPPSRRAFGYNQDGTPHPTEAPIVVDIFGQYLAGATVVSIAKQLTANGHRTARGREWRDTGVRQLLMNPRYIAERHYRGERITEGEWEPLVSVDTFRAAQAKLNDPTRKKVRSARRHLGSSLFRCWCGAMTKSSYTAGGKRVYVCSARRHMQRNADEVDAVVRRVVVDRLRREDVLDLIPQNDTAGKQTAELHRESVALHGRVDEVAAEFARGNLTGRQVRVATEQIETRLDEIERILADSARKSALASIAGATDLGDAWLSLPLDRQRAVLKDIVTVVLLPGKVGRGKFDDSTVGFEWPKRGD